MRSNQSGLAIRAEWKAHARIVREGDEVGERFEGVGGERHPGRGFAGDEFEDLRHFDDGGGGDDGEAETLRNRELEAWRGRLEVQEEDLMAGGPEEGDEQGRERGGEVVGKGGEVGTESVEYGCESLVHCGKRWRCDLVERKLIGMRSSQLVTGTLERHVFSFRISLALTLVPTCIVGSTLLHTDLFQLEIPISNMKAEVFINWPWGQSAQYEVATSTLASTRTLYSGHSSSDTCFWSTDYLFRVQIATFLSAIAPVFLNLSSISCGSIRSLI